MSSLLNIIIQTLHYQTKVIDEHINTSKILKKPETMRAMGSPTSKHYRKGTSSSPERSRSPQILSG